MRQTISTRTTQTQSTENTENTHDQTHCNECDTRLHNNARGEKYCPDCGLVVEEDNIDHGPEWRAFTHEEQQSKRRTGSPETVTLHDKGLSTQIGWRDKDAKGNALSNRQRRKMRRLRRWDEQGRTKDSKERNLRKALSEINRMTSALDLPDTVNETAAVIYRRAVDEDLLVGRSIEGVATASMYCACRQSRVPRTLNDISNVSRVEHSRVSSAYRHLSNELGLELPPSDPREFIPKIASNADVPDIIRAEAENLVKAYTEYGAHAGKHPVGVAAASLYSANKLLNEQTKLTQEDAANAADVCIVTIRSRHEELVEFEDAIETDPQTANNFNKTDTNPSKDVASSDDSDDDTASEMDVEEVTLKQVSGNEHLVVLPSDGIRQNDVMESVIEILIEDYDLLDTVDLPYKAPSATKNKFLVRDPEQDAPDQKSTWHEMQNGFHINTKLDKGNKESNLNALANEIGMSLRFDW